MSIARTILIKSLVKQYYRQNAALLTFFLFMMTAAVGSANGAGLVQYHYSLIRGMLTSTPFLLFVLFAWFLYAGKCSQFVNRTLSDRQFSFLYKLSLMGFKRSYGLLLLVQGLLFLPVILYALIIACVGFYRHWNMAVIIVLFYIIGICMLSARWYQYLLENPGIGRYRWKLRFLSWKKYYWNIFIRDVLTNKKRLFLIVKIYNCGVLYLLLKDQTLVDYDLRMVILFYSFGLLGHGVFIYQLRGMEERMLGFYRALPVSLFKRWTQYAFLYFLLLIPEIIVITRLTPVHLRYPDALWFVFFSYSILLMLNSLLFIRFFRKIDYLKILTGLFLLIFICVLSDSLTALALFSFILSFYIFFRSYYRFEI